MVCRRWWCHVALVAVIGAMPAVVFAAPADDADAMKSAPAAATVEGQASKRDIVERTIKAAPGGASARDPYGRKVADAFGPLLTDPDAANRVNAAIVIEKMQTLSTSDKLVDMLGNNDPAVRYQGAKGLGGTQIVTNLKALGGKSLQNAVGGLRAAGAKETSAIVLQEIIKAINAYKDLDALLDTGDHIASMIAANLPDVEMLRTAQMDLDGIAALASSGNAAQKKHAAEVAAKLASFTAQQRFAQEQILTAQGGTLGGDYDKTSNDVMNSAAKAAGAAAGKNYSLPTPFTSGSAMQLEVRGLFGGEGAPPGKLQTDMPGVAVPKQIKAAP